MSDVIISVENLGKKYFITVIYKSTSLRMAMRTLPDGGTDRAARMPSFKLLNF